jgi:integrase
MVSQSVSQQQESEKSNVTHLSKMFSKVSACPFATSEFPSENLLSNADKSVVPSPQNKVQKSGTGDVKSDLATLQSTEYLTQSKTLCGGLVPANKQEVPSTQLASTAPSPNSHEEVSGMPGKGNGCIFRTKTKSGKAIWKVEVTVGYKPNGQRIRTRRTAHSLASAREIHRRLIAETHSGDIRTKSSETFAQYALWWLQAVKGPRVRQSTLADYEDRLRRSVFPFFGDRRLHDISSRDVENWLFELRKSGCAATTTNGARQVMGAVMKHAVVAGVLAKNPVDLTERVKRKRDEITSVQTPWSLREAQDVLRVTTGTKFDLFTRLALLLGLRRGEILALTWEDVNFEDGLLTVRSSLREERVIDSSGKGRTQLVVGDTKTLNSKRKLHLTPEVLSSFQRHREHLYQTRTLSKSRWQDSRFVIVDSIGGAMNPGNFVKAFRCFLKEQNVRIIRVHDMRHTAAVLSLEAGVRIESVSQALGHSRIDITKTVYAPYVQPLMTEFALGLSDYLAPFDVEKITPPVNQRIEV